MKSALDISIKISTLLAWVKSFGHYASKSLDTMRQKNVWTLCVKRFGHYASAKVWTLCVDLDIMSCFGQKCDGNWDIMR